MSDHVLKPVLIGLFVLVVLIAAVALVFSTAPQASEITSSTASPRATTTSTGSYYAPAAGTVECSDGEDNDGDGLTDWSATADTSTVDLECDSARDRSERYSGEQ